MKKGKAYANRKRVEIRSPNDFFQTPKCLTWELLNAENNKDMLWKKQGNEKVNKSKSGTSLQSTLLMSP